MQKIVLAFMRDWTTLHPEAKKSAPFISWNWAPAQKRSRFSFYFIKTLLELMEGLGIKDIKFCYIMSDFTKHNIKYWEEHPALKPYITQGLVDFALYDMEAERPIHLIRKNVQLSPELLVNPLTVFANYIFDTVSHDAFTVQDHKLYELLFSLHTDETNMDHNRPVQMEKIGVDYNIHENQKRYYGDASLDAILVTLYIKELHSTSFLIPMGSIHAIKFLKNYAMTNYLLFQQTKKAMAPSNTWII